MLEAIPLIPADCDLYVERLLPLLVSQGGLYAVEPWVGGTFFQHPLQNHKVLHHANLGAEQWRNMARRLGAFIADSGDESWRMSLTDSFAQMAVSDRLNWLRDEYTADLDWKAVHPIAHEARELLVASLPPDVRPRPASKRSLVRTLIKDLIPPILLKSAVTFRRALSRR